MKKQIFTLLTLLLCVCSGAWADDYYTPTADEVIILNEVYSATATTTGYSTHAAIAWAGTASTNNKKAGDPNNNGEATSSNVACYSVKGNGGGKNITVNITGVSKIIIYHESHSSRYLELRSGSKTGTLIGNGSTNTYYTEVSLSGVTEYSIFLHGTGGTDDQDFNVYAVKLIKGSDADTESPVIITDLNTAYTAYTGVKFTLSVAALHANSYQWYSKVNSTDEWAAIEGATSSSYEYTPVADDENTSRYYYCKVSNSEATGTKDVTSATALVTFERTPTIDDLVAITSNYTFIADNITSNGTVGLSANMLYDSKRIFSPLGNSVATNKGKSTINGVEHFNSLRLKNDTQDKLAFKVGSPCWITFYSQVNDERTFKVGTADDDDKYGTRDATKAVWSCYISEAATIYLIGTGDLYIAGFEVIFDAAIAPAKEYTTYVTPAALDFTGLDLKAYVATAASSSEITMVPVTTVPAGTPVVLKKGSAASYDVPVAASATAPVTNLLKASDGVSTIGGDGVWDYILSDGKFYHASAGVLPAGKCYLHLDSAPSGAHELSLSFEDETTAISDALRLNDKRKMTNDSYFDLQGRKVAQPTCGLYIVNGRKVVIK